MSVFDENLFLKGLEQRKGTLGAEYVTKNLEAAGDFTRPFQEAMTAWCWGFGWGDEVIDAKAFQRLRHTAIDPNHVDNRPNFFLGHTICDRTAAVNFPFMHFSQGTNHRKVHH